MKKKRVCIVTGTRAEYGLFYPIMQKIKTSQYLELQLVATTMHMSPEFGSTYKQIEADGFVIDEKIENLIASDTKSAIAKSTGLATMLLSSTFERLNPDIVLLLGDRFETHAAATTAMLMNLPIAHIHGGEITEGAVDEQIRHSITKMAQLHFTSTQEYKKRVVQMGEDASRVFVSGAPGIDNILNMQLLTKERLQQELGWEFKDKSALFTYHPVTLEDSSKVKDEIEAILKVLQDSELQVLFTYANADDNGRVINQKLEEFTKTDPTRFKVVKNLGQLRYLSAMKHVDLLIGNTSSGIIEAASFHKPVVNIGERQKGRLQSGNVLDCGIKTLKNAINKALSSDFKLKCEKIENIYGHGNASGFIVDTLQKKKFLVRKQFVDEE